MYIHFQTESQDQIELMTDLALLDRLLGSKIWPQMSWLLSQVRVDLDFHKCLCDPLPQSQTWEYHPIF